MWWGPWFDLVFIQILNCVWAEFHETSIWKEKHSFKIYIKSWCVNKRSCSHYQSDYNICYDLCNKKSLITGGLIFCENNGFEKPVIKRPKFHRRWRRCWYNFYFTSWLLPNNNILLTTLLRTLSHVLEKSSWICCWKQQLAEFYARWKHCWLLLSYVTLICFKQQQIKRSLLSYRGWNGIDIESSLQKLKCTSGKNIKNFISTLALEIASGNFQNQVVYLNFLRLFRLFSGFLCLQIS